jgi:nucleoside triphosphate diphosphatase
VKPSREIGALIEIMAALRTPTTGCPWDLEQTFATIAPYTIEEAYEVADAIARGDLEDLRDELGDLLLQVVFHARMATEQRAFDFGDVVQAITEKLVRRHPHVFGDAAKLSPNEVRGLWEQIKAAEKAERASRRPPRDGEGHIRQGALAGVPPGLPALTRALELQGKAARVGFDWGDPGPVLAKIREETDEIATAAATADREQVSHEIGDLMFSVVNLARHFGVDPESALRTTNIKFERRFAAIERALAARGITPQQSTLAEMDALWEDCKRAEKITAAANGAETARPE